MLLFTMYVNNEVYHQKMAMASNKLENDTELDVN